MRILGLDVGDRFIGVALSDALGLTAQPLARIDRRQTAAADQAVATLAAQHEAQRIVIGLPLTLRGEEGPQAGKVRAFAARVQRRARVPVEFVDERLTTAQGQRALLEAGASRRTRKQVIDQVAAQLILQHYLDAHRPTAS